MDILDITILKVAFIMKSKMNDEKKLVEIEEEETGSYLQLSFNRAPKKNHEAIAELGKQYGKWLNKHGVSYKVYYLNNRSSTRTTNGEAYETLGSIAKTLSIGDNEEEEPWVAVQIYKDRARADQIRSKMSQDETVGTLAKQFYSLVIPRNSIITEWIQAP